jgi:MinD-like ATPase involved in chromosome partitioning or flagellar assembly
VNSIPKEPYIIGVVSQKGGVGKTSLAVNLAADIKSKGYRVLLIDGDTSNPTLGMLLGMEGANIGFRELATKATTLDNAMSIHGSTGMHVVLGTFHTKPFIITKSNINTLKKKLRRARYDFIIIDTSPGFYDEDEMDYWNDVILVTTPDAPATTGIMRLNALIRRTRLASSLVLNKVRKQKYELKPDEIAEATGERIVAVIPYDETVNISVAEKIPAYVKNRSAPFSKAIETLASAYIRKRRLAKRPRS